MNGDYSALMDRIIYKIATKAEWAAADEKGVFAGAPIDLADGYIHFSTAGQVKETAAKHFAGMDGLLLVAIDPSKLGAALKYEPSRGGQLFPHLYAPLDLSAVIRVDPLPWADGAHVFPELDA